MNYFVDKTWWPLPWTWDASNCNVGVWTESNEIWYRERKQALEGGNLARHQPLETLKWRSSLKQRKSTSRIMNGMDGLCERFINGEILDNGM